MKTSPARQAKLERLRTGLRLAVERKLDLKLPERRAELAHALQRDHQLARPLAQRYARSVAALVEAFPEGEPPADVVESHVDALGRHDEAYSKKLVVTDDRHVLVLKGAQTVVRRSYLWLDEGDVFILGGRRFRVVRVSHERVDAITAEEARREGFASVDEWRRAWVEARPRAASARPQDELAWRHEVSPVDELR